MKTKISILAILAWIGLEILNAQQIKIDSGKKKITIGLIGKIAGNPLFVASYTGARVAAKELGEKYNVEVNIDWQTPTTENVQEQAASLNRFVRSKADGIAIACSDANYLTPTINDAIEKGMPVLCYDSDAPDSKRFAYFGANDIEFGQMLMKELAGHMNGKGNIAVLAGNKNALNLKRRLQGVKEELKKYPNIILSQENIYHNLDIPERASETIARAQRENPKISGWIFITSSALQIKNSLKWNPGEVKVVAGNAVPAQLEYVKSGYVQSLVGVNCFQLGYKSVEILLEKILKRKDPSNSIAYAPLTPVKSKNVDEWSLNWKKWLLKEALH